MAWVVACRLDFRLLLGCRYYHESLSLALWQLASLPEESLVTQFAIDKDS